MRRKEFSYWLQFIIVFCGILGLVFCLYFAPELGKAFLVHSEKTEDLYIPFIIFIWATAIPFYVALLLGWHICLDINSNLAFTIINANRLKRISVLAISEVFLYVIGLIYLFITKNFSEDILTILLLIIFFAIIISVFTAMLSHLVREASKIKNDNDLTI